MAESHFIGRDMDGGGNAKGPAQSVFAWEAAAAANKKEKTTTANGRTYAAVTARKRKAAPVAKLGAYVTYGDEGGAPHKELVSASPTQSSPVGYVMMETKRGAAASPPASSIFPTAKKKSVMKKRSKTADYISLAPKKPSILPSIFKRKAPSIKSKQSKKSKSKMARSTAAKTRTGVAANGFTSPSVVSAVKQSEVLWPTKMKKPISESMGYKIIKSTIKNMEPTKRYLLMTTTAPEPPTQIVPPPQPTVQIEEPDLQKTASGSDVRFASNATEKVAPPAPKSTVFSFIDRPKKPKASVFSIIPAKKNQDTVFDEIERRRDGTSKKSYHLKKSCRILIFVFAILIIGAIIFSIYFGITKFAPRTTPSDSIIVSTALSNVKNVSNYQDPKTTNHLFVVNSRTTIAKAISTIGKTTNKAKN